MTNTSDLLAILYAADDEDDDSFALDPPNAALSCFDSSGEAVRAVVELISVLSSFNDDVQFEANVLYPASDPAQDFACDGSTPLVVDLRTAGDIVIGGEEEDYEEAVKEYYSGR